MARLIEIAVKSWRVPKIASLMRDITLEARDSNLAVRVCRGVCAIELKRHSPQGLLSGNPGLKTAETRLWGLTTGIQPGIEGKRGLVGEEHPAQDILVSHQSGWCKQIAIERNGLPGSKGYEIMEIGRCSKITQHPIDALGRKCNDAHSLLSIRLGLAKPSLPKRSGSSQKLQSLTSTMTCPEK
jgi:hypothetical protein